VQQVPGKKVADQAIIDRLTALLKGHEEVCAAYLFGSRARGSEGVASDVDIAVAFTAGALAWDEVELAEQLAAQLGVPVQVIDLVRAGPYIVEAVYREGVRLVGDAQLLAEAYQAMEEDGSEEALPERPKRPGCWNLLRTKCDVSTGLCHCWLM